LPDWIHDRPFFVVKRRFAVPVAIALLVLALWRGLDRGPGGFEGLLREFAGETAEESRPRGDGSPRPEPDATVGGYDRFEGVRLVPKPGNDGDSFFVVLGGEEVELRLYFVDAPETYYSDRWENQRKRVEDQGRAFGGLGVEATVSLGERAKEAVAARLSVSPFTVYTQWEPVFDSERVYGFVELADGVWLDEWLVAAGLARIHTKGPGSAQNPVPTPQGRSFHEHRRLLGRLEAEAKRERRGAWGL